MPTFDGEAPDALMVPEGIMSGYDIPVWTKKKKKWLKQTVPHEYLENRLAHIESIGSTIFGVVEYSEHELLIIYYNYE